MTRRSTSLAVALGAAALILASCSSGGSDSSSTTAAPATLATTTTSSTAASATTGSTPTSASTSTTGSTTTTSAPSKGCTVGSAPVPAGAASQQTIDVDGDGRLDTTWIATGKGPTMVGIVTATGGGSQIPYDSASPIPRRVLVVNADEQGPVEIIVTDGRGASLYAFMDCQIQPVRNVQGQTYEFDLQNLRGMGTGVGCIATSKGRRLVGLQADDRTASKVSWSSTVVELDGLEATNGAKASGTYALPADQTKAALLSQIACGNRTMAADGLTERG